MPRPPREVSKVRVNLDLHPEVKTLLEEVRDEIHADSMSEVVRRAVLAYRKLLDEGKEKIE